MKQPAIFFDRDNTLIVNDGYLGDPDGVVLVDGAAEAVARVRRVGYVAITFSNQSGVARGLFTEEDVRRVNARLDEMLRRDDAEAVIDRHEFCPHHAEGIVPRYRQNSNFRKPAPGMIFCVARELQLDLGRSWVVGDAPSDIAAGRAAGCRTILFKHPDLPLSRASRELPTVEADFVAANLKEVADVIEFNSSAKQEPPAERVQRGVEGSDGTPLRRAGPSPLS
jgi:D-glycero-D-manno-heptose 1,7-bisphosphate phosphatase